MWDPWGSEQQPGGIRQFAERKVEGTMFKFAARALMIVGGTIAPIAGGLVVFVFVVVLGIRDDLRDIRKDTTYVMERTKEQDAALKELRDQLRQVERRQDMSR